MNISVVVPVYNEEDNLTILTAELKEILDTLGRPYEVVFVDDGSADRSFQILKELAASDSVLRVVRFRENAGQTAAFAAGFAAARGDIIVTMDADLQNDPRDIPLLLKEMERFDVVCGWRHRRRDPWIKIVSSRIANAVRNMLSEKTVTDTGCSLKAFRRNDLMKLKLFKGMHRFLPTLLKIEGCTVTEVKVNHRERRFGQTKYNIRNRMVGSFVDLLAVRWMKQRHISYEIEEVIE